MEETWSYCLALPEKLLPLGILITCNFTACLSTPPSLPSLALNLGYTL